MVKAAANPPAQSGSATPAAPAEPSATVRRNKKKKRSPASEPSAQEIRVEQIKCLLSLFAIANRYDFYLVRQYAIRAIEKLRVESGSGLNDVWSAVDRIEMADRFDVDEWLVPAYEELCTRPAMLSVQEGERIGGRKATIIAVVRETVFRQNYAFNRTYGASWAPDINSVQNALTSVLSSLNTPVTT